MSSSLTSSLLPTLYVALGGALGAAARFQVGLFTARWSGLGSPFPWGTLTVNILGSLAMGALMGWFARTGQGSEAMRLGLTVGVLGGFTTFSAFSAELVTMIHRGHLLMAAGYGTASVIAGMVALFIGLIVVQSA